MNKTWDWNCDELGYVMIFQDGFVRNIAGTVEI